MPRRVSGVSGHRVTYEALGPRKPRRRIPGGWLVRCLCGWEYRGARDRVVALRVFGEHLLAVMPSCTHCGPTPKSRMSRSEGQGSLCKVCITRKSQAWKAAHPERFREQVRKSWLKIKYGMTPAQYDVLLASQGGACAICGSLPSDPRGFKLHVDHDHGTGRVRGILCGPCNAGLGSFRDDTVRMERAIAYLRKGALGLFKVPEDYATAAQRTRPRQGRVHGDGDRREPNGQHDPEPRGHRDLERALGR